MNPDLSHLITKHEAQIDAAFRTGDKITLSNAYLAVTIDPPAHCRRCGNPRPRVQGRQLCFRCGKAEFAPRRRR